MFEVASPLALHLANENDLDFFKKLYATTRDELKALQLSPQKHAELIESQQKVQEQGLQMTFPNAQQWTVVLQNEDPLRIGRLIVDFTLNDWRVIDIAIMPEYRKQGYGQQLMRAVMDKARATNATVSLSVMGFNRDARRFYERLKFTEVKRTAIYTEMIWRSIELQVA